MLGNSCGGLEPQQRVLVYNSCIKPILAYGLALWYSEWGLGVRNKVKRLEKVQNFAIRWITGGFRTTPIGAMELLSGIPPVVVWCNLALAKYTARITSLLENHLLKIVYHYDPLPSRYRHLPRKQRRRNLPDDNPVTRLKTDLIHEHFNPYHEEAHPGSRVLDLYLERVTFWHMDAPKKSDGSFKEWLREYKQWLTREMESREMVIFTDGAFWAKSKRGAAAIVIWKNGKWLEERVEWCAAASSYDAEIAAIEMALTRASDFEDTESVTIVTDNKAAIQGALDTAPHSSQNCSIRTSILARHWLERSGGHAIRFVWCPSHVGITGNEKADAAAKKGGDVEVTIGILRENFLIDAKRKATKWWRAKAKAPSYTGKDWIPLRRKGKIFRPAIGSTTKKFFTDLVLNSMPDMARLTRALTNHAPTGEYRRRFFPDKPDHCHHCGEGTLHSRTHILTTCDKYQLRFSSLGNLKANKKNDGLFKAFLHKNPSAFTFEDLPPDPP